ncbi:MAG: type I phosphomannose isomerase catalytic subunit [Planctomycetota bacterium]
MSDHLTQPLAFEPRLVPKMWGSRRLEKLGKTLPADEPIGESWELFDFPPGVVDAGWTSAAVAGGPLAGKTLHDLMADDATRAAILGQAKPVETPAGPQFPLLIKFLDAGDDLSVQVHPDEAYAAAHADAHLKNECWYVLAHDPAARLLKGLKPGVDRDGFEQAIADGTVESLIEAIPAADGDCHYLPSGTVHALGGGMLVAEVQTPSDTTYRVFDFKRKDPKTGEERELHVDQALECIDFAGTGPKAPDVTRGDGRLVYAPQFTLDRMTIPAGDAVTLPDGCLVTMTVAGDATISGVSASAGQTLLVPASSGRTVTAATETTLLVARPR